MELLLGIKQAKWAESAHVTTKDTDILNLLPDPICNLNITKLKLSVWDIGSKQARLGETIKQLDLSRENRQNYDYAIFSSDILDELGISFNNTFSKLAKEISEYHYDIYIPSSEILLELTKSLILYAERDRMTKMEIARLP